MKKTITGVIDSSGNEVNNGDTMKGHYSFYCAKVDDKINSDYAKFLETGCDYSNEMFKRDQAQIRRGEWLAALCFFASGLLAGFVLANLVGAV